MDTKGFGLVKQNFPSTVKYVMRKTLDISEDVCKDGEVACRQISDMHIKVLNAIDNEKIQ